MLILMVSSAVFFELEQMAVTIELIFIFITFGSSIIEIITWKWVCLASV